MVEFDITTVIIIFSFVGGIIASYFKQRNDVNNQLAKLQSQIDVLVVKIKPIWDNVEKNISRLLMTETTTRRSLLLEKVRRRTINLAEINELKSLLEVWMESEIKEKGEMIVPLNDMLSYLEMREKELKYQNA